MANKTLQFLRNANLYETREDALTGLQAQLATAKPGEPIIATYGTSENAHTLFGVKGTAGYEIFDNQGSQSQAVTSVQYDGTSKKITYTKNGVATDVVTLADVATSGAAADVSIADAGGIITATNVEGALQEIAGKINGMDAEVTSSDGKNVQVKVTEADGAITAVNITTDNTINATDLATAIQGLDKSDAAVSGQFVTAVSEADGIITVSRDNLTNAVLAGYAADTTKTGAIVATDTLEQALNKLENKTAAITVASADKTVTVTNPAGGGTDLAVNIDGTTLVKDSSTGVISSDLKIVKNSSPSDTSVKEEYYLAYGSSSSAIGDTIKIYKDSALLSIKLLHAYNVGQSGEILPTYSNGTWTDIDSQYQTEENVALCYAYSDATGATVIAAVPVGDFLQESEFKDGLQVVSGEVSVKIDANSEYVTTASGVTSPVLSVSSNGVKVDNIQTAINYAVSTATGGLNHNDTAVSHQFVTEVDETNGVISVQRAQPTAGDIATTAITADSTHVAIAGTDAATQIDNISVAIKAEETARANAIAGLDFTDAAVANQFVTAVNETDGVISVTRAQPAAAGVTVADSGDYFTATDVEAALAELAVFDAGTY